MGIQGLIGLVDNASTLVNISQLKGSVCVIDGYGWLHKACYGCAEQLYLGPPTQQYVNYCLKKTQMFINAGIKPIVVFDGQRLPAKELTHRNRQSLRHNTRQKIELLLSDGNESKARELMRSCIEVTPEMARNLMIALRAKDIDFVVAPFEADAQMAYLVNNGFADFVVTEDSDLMVYNCRLCLFKLDPNGNGKLVDMSLISECIGNEFDSNKFRHMSILSGCDYLPNLPGIGLQRAKKFFKLTQNTHLETVLYKVPNYLKMEKKIQITTDYVNDFIKADNTFKYQLVFCPKRRQLVPLTPYENGIKPEDVKYAGTYFDESLGPDFAFQYAIGNVDTKTLKIIDSYCLQPKSNSIWSEFWSTSKKSYALNPIISQKLSQNKVMPINGYNNDNNSKQTDCLNTTKESQNSGYFNKRLKVDENRSASCSQLFREYSSQVIETNQMVSTNLTNSQKTATYKTRNQIRSRNIFKVANNLSEEKTTQSKYFACNQLETSSQQSDDIPVNTLSPKLLNAKQSPNLSQYSLNSTGNTATDCSLDEVLTLSDSDRSEISETSEEEIFVINSFTKLKPKTNKSVQQLSQMNSTFINSSKKSEIRSYFKSFK